MNRLPLMIQAAIDDAPSPAAAGAVGINPPYVGDAKRPRTRAECIDGPRPCPHSSCRYHLRAPSPKAITVAAARGAFRPHAEAAARLKLPTSALSGAISRLLWTALRAAAAPVPRRSVCVLRLRRELPLTHSRAGAGSRRTSPCTASW